VQAMTLTALVIGFAVTAVLLALVVAVHRARGSIDLDELGRQETQLAATAIAHDAQLLTRDADFGDVPRLRVVKLSVGRGPTDMTAQRDARRRPPDEQTVLEEQHLRADASAVTIQPAMSWSPPASLVAAIVLFGS